jgi:hypothetical protein
MGHLQDLSPSIEQNPKWVKRVSGYIQTQSGGPPNFATSFSVVTRQYGTSTLPGAHPHTLAVTAPQVCPDGQVAEHVPPVDRQKKHPFAFTRKMRR